MNGNKVEASNNLRVGAISVVIPTYQRGRILLPTIEQLLIQTEPADEILIVEQTPYEDDDPLLAKLNELADKQQIVLMRRAEPSIPAAMNHGLRHARGDYVLFLDDDVEFGTDFIASHRNSLLDWMERENKKPIAQVGQVLQPQQVAIDIDPHYSGGVGLYQDLAFPFNAKQPQKIANCMAGNLCVHRETALGAGGFDENFSGAAYRFETEFCRRMCRYTNDLFVYSPAASLRHLQWREGGTRAHANHLTSNAAVHSMGDYYFALREGDDKERRSFILSRLRQGLVAKFYLRRPWYLPVRLLAECRGYRAAKRLVRGEAKLIADNEIKRLPRLAAFMSHATQHFAPLYKEIATHGKVRLKVFYLCENGVDEYHDAEFSEAIKWDVPLLKGYEYEFLNPGLVLQEFNFLTMDSKNIRSAIRKFKPDVIWLHGYGQRANWRAWWHRRGAKLLYSSDSNAENRRSFLVRMIKRGIVRLFFSKVDAFLSISTANHQYLNLYGVQDKQIIDSRFPIDMDRWTRARDAVTDADLQEMRAELDIPNDALILLFAGKFIARKRAGDVLEALAQLGQANQLRQVNLILVGSGPEQANLEQRAVELNVGDKVRFVGFKNQAELACYFALAQVFIFPSLDEPYGAIAAEVLPFGLPIIAAHGIGAVGAAIVEGRNALLYQGGDVDALSKCIIQLVDDPDLRQSMALESTKLARQQDVSVMASDITTYCEAQNPKNLTKQTQD